MLLILEVRVGSVDIGGERGLLLILEVSGLLLTLEVSGLLLILEVRVGCC